MDRLVVMIQNTEISNESKVAMAAATEKNYFATVAVPVKQKQ